MTLLDKTVECKSAHRLCFMGIGNLDYGDDGFGVRLAQELIAAGLPNVIIGGPHPEESLQYISDQSFEEVVFLDAIDFGAQAGSVILTGRDDIENHFPQISTHKISLSVLAKLIESNGKTRVWLLGAQPESLKQGHLLSPKLEKTRRILTDLLLQAEPQRWCEAVQSVHDVGVHAC